MQNATSANGHATSGNAQMPTISPRHANVMASAMVAAAAAIAEATLPSPPSHTTPTPPPNAAADEPAAAATDEPAEAAADAASGVAGTGAAAEGGGGVGQAASTTGGAGNLQTNDKGSTGLRNPALLERHKSAFYQKLSAAKKTGHMSRAEQERVINVLEAWDNGSGNRQKSDYNLAVVYTVRPNVARDMALCRKLKDGSPGAPVALTENVHSIIMQYHLVDNGHAKSARAQAKAICQEYYGVTQREVQQFIDLCPTCLASVNKIKAKQQPLKMILSPTIGKRLQIDLIDMRSCPDPVTGDKWILVVSDHHSGYGECDAMQSKTATETGPKVILEP